MMFLAEKSQIKFLYLIRSKTNNYPDRFLSLSGGFQLTFKYDFEYSIASEGESLDLSVIDKKALGKL